MKTKHVLTSILCLMIWSSAYSAESEPNDSRAQANTLTLNGNNSGAIGTATDVDWWKVTTNKDGQLSVTITVSNGIYCWVSLYDNNGTTVLNETYSTTTATATKDGLAAGVYYINVRPFYPGQMPAYTIANTLINAAFTNDVEPNNTKAAALTLALNSSAKGHVGYYYQLKRDTFDWYKITTNVDGTLKLNLTPSNGQYTWCYLYDNDGTTVLASSYSTASFNISRADLAAGTYFVRVNCYYSSDFAPYTLVDSLFPPVESNDAEPNGTKAQALTFPTNSTVSGHVGYYYNLKRDTADWYKIVTNKDGMISLTITSTNGHYTWAYLYDNDGTTILNSYYTLTSLTFTTDGLAAGTYYVRVNCYYSQDFSPYTLSNSLTTYTNINDALSNDYARLGKTLPANQSTQGHVGFRNNGGARDPIDWWKINYTGSGNLTVTLNYESPYNGPTPFTWLSIYKDTASSPIFNTYTANGNVTANLTGLTKDYYYVAVVMFYPASSWTAYNLTPTFTQNNCVTAVSATTTHAGSSCTNSYITFQVTGGKNAYLQLYRYGVAQGVPVAVDGTGSHKFDNLSPGNYYAVGFSDGATGGCQATSPSATVVPKPKNLSATNVTSTAADVNWTLLSCVKFYYVQYRILGDTKWKKKTTAGNVATYHLTGLSPDTTYEYRVAANDSANGQTANGKYSAISTFGTLARLGTSHTSSAQDLNVYPNPASSNVHITFENGTEGEVTMRLFDITGKIVFVRNVKAASGTINEELDLTGLNTGVYQLQVIMADGNVLNQSIVKARE